MGIIEVPGRVSGRNYTIRIAGDIPTDEERGRINQFLSQREGAFTQEYTSAFGEAPLPQDDGTAFGRGWESGMVNARGGIGELLQTLGQRTGFDTLADYGTGVERRAAIDESMLSFTQPPKKSLKETSGIGEKLTWLGEIAGGSAPIMGAAALGGLGAAALGPTIGVGTGTAGLLGAAATSLPFFTGENLQEQEIYSGEDNVNLGKAAAIGAFQSALDAASLKILGRLGIGKAVMQTLQGEKGAGLGMRLLTGAGAGAATEAPTEALQELLTIWQAGGDLESPESQDRLFEALVAGGALGGVLGGAGRATFGLREDATTSDPSAPPELLALPPPAPPELLALPPPGAAPATPPGAAPATPPTAVRGPEDIAPGISEDAALVDTRGIFDERLSIGESDGAPRADAAKAAAKSAIAYIDSMPDPSPALKRYRGTLVKIQRGQIELPAGPTLTAEERKIAEAEAEADARAAATQASEVAGEREAAPLEAYSEEDIATDTEVDTSPRSEPAGEREFAPPGAYVDEDADTQQGTLALDAAASTPNTEAADNVLQAASAGALDMAAIRAQEAAAKRAETAAAVAAIEKRTEELRVAQAAAEEAAASAQKEAETAAAVEAAAAKQSNAASNRAAAAARGAATKAANKAAAAAKAAEDAAKDATAKAAEDAAAKAAAKAAEDIAAAAKGAAHAEDDAQAAKAADDAEAAANKASEAAEVRETAARVNEATAIATLEKRLKAVRREGVAILNKGKLDLAALYRSGGAELAAAVKAVRSAEIALQKAESSQTKAENAEMSARQTYEKDRAMGGVLTRKSLKKKTEAFADAIEKTKTARAAVAQARSALRAAQRVAEASQPSMRTTAEVMRSLAGPEKKAFSAYLAKLKEAQSVADSIASAKLAIASRKNPNYTPDNVWPRIWIKGRIVPVSATPSYAPADSGPHPLRAYRARMESIYSALLSGFRARTTDRQFRYTTSNGAINSPAAWTEVDDWMSLDDQQRVLDLLSVPHRAPSGRVSEASNLSGDAALAWDYFAKTVRPIDAIALMVEDVRGGQKQYNAEAEGTVPGSVSEDIEGFLKFMGSERAEGALRWVRENLSEHAGVRITNMEKVKAVRAKQEQTWFAAEKGRLASNDPNSVWQAMSRQDPLAGIDADLSVKVKTALAAGDLKGALLALQNTSANPEIKAFAKAAMAHVGTTRVHVAYPGGPKHYLLGGNAGVFWQSIEAGKRQNIIYLDGKLGLNTHTLLHEVGHMLSANVINNPNDPITKQLDMLRRLVMKANGITEEAAEGSAAMYGLTNVSEFVAEGWGRLGLGVDQSGLREMLRRTKVDTVTQSQEELPLDGWTRFKEIISNIFNRIMGRPPARWPRNTRTVENTVSEPALSMFQRLTTGIFSEAPQVLPDFVMQKAVSSPLIATRVLNNMTAVMPKWGADARKEFADHMDASTPSPIRRGLLSLLQLEWFADLAQKYLPQVYALKTVDDLRRGYIDTRAQLAKGTSLDAAKYAKEAPKDFGTMYSAAMYATRVSVDPHKPMADYNGDVEKLGIWQEINGMLDGVADPARARSLFKTMKRQYEATQAELHKILEANVAAVEADPVARTSLLNKLMEKLSETGVIDPYFHLMRDGDYWMTYVSRDTLGKPELNAVTGAMQQPVTQYIHAFGSVWERADFLKRLQNTKFPDGSPVLNGEPDLFMKSDAFNPSRSVQPEFLAGVTAIIDAHVPTTAEHAEANASAKAAILDLFLKRTPAHSMLRSFTTRKGVRGFIGDVTPLGVVDAPSSIAAAHAENAVQQVYQLANLKFAPQINRLLAEAEKSYRDVNSSPNYTSSEKSTAKSYIEELRDRAAFAKNPRISKNAQRIRTGTFVWTLGAYLSSAINALMQVPMIGISELSGRYGLSGATRELGFAARLVLNSGKHSRHLTYGPDGMVMRGDSGVDYAGSLANYFEVGESGHYRLRSDADAPRALQNVELADKIRDLDTLVEMLAANGMLTHSQSQEMMDAPDLSAWVGRVNKFAGLPMHFAERFNRQTMAVAAYNLELEKMRSGGRTLTAADKTNAAIKALETTEMVNGSIGAASAPRIAHSSGGSVITLYKRFGLSMARYIVNSVKNSVASIDTSTSENAQKTARENRAIARYQLAGMFGATMLLSGVQGLPFFGEIMALLNAGFTDDDEDRFEVLTQKFVQEPFYHGALNYLTGWEMATRISLSGLIYRPPLIEKDQSALYNLIETFGGPTVGVVLSGERGIKLLNDGEVQRGLEALSPAAIRSLMKSVRYGMDGARTMRGDEVVPVNAWDVAGQAIGFSPATYARAQRAASAEKKKMEAVAQQKSRLYSRYYRASKEGDFAERAAIIDEMREFSKRHPEAAISRADLKKSLKGFEARSKTMVNGVNFNKRDLPGVQNSLDEYGSRVTAWSGA